MLPEGFLDAYTRELGGPPPAEFLEAYELLCDALYYGTGLAPEDPGRVTGGSKHQFWFGDYTLLGFKTAVDRRLAQIRSNLRRWATARARQGKGRSGSKDHDRRHLDRAVRARRSGPDGGEKR